MHAGCHTEIAQGVLYSLYPNQRLFLQLSLAPEWSSAKYRPDLAIAFVIDTSGSMRELVASDSDNGSAASRLDLVMASMEAVLNSQHLRDEDRISLISFDDDSRVNVPFLPASRRASLLAAVHRLNRYSGGTHMGAGLRKALQLLEPEAGSKRIILLTDGETMDEDLVQDMSRSLCDLHIPVTAIGVGDFNESILTSVADETQGRILDVVADRANPDPPSISANQLPEAILGEMNEATREVITDLALTIKAVKGTAVNRVTRVAPQQVEVNLDHKPYILAMPHSGRTPVLLSNSRFRNGPPTACAWLNWESPMKCLVPITGGKCRPLT